MTRLTQAWQVILTFKVTDAGAIVSMFLLNRVRARTRAGSGEMCFCRDAVNGTLSNYACGQIAAKGALIRCRTSR